MGRSRNVRPGRCLMSILCLGGPLDGTYVNHTERIICAPEVWPPRSFSIHDAIPPEVSYRQYLYVRKQQADSVWVYVPYVPGIDD